jgi:hypothetical protein
MSLPEPLFPHPPEISHPIPTHVYSNKFSQQSVDALVKEYVRKNKLSLPHNFRQLEEGTYQCGSKKIHVQVLSEGLLVGKFQLIL